MSLGEGAWDGQSARRGGNHGNPATVHHLAPVTLTSVSGKYLRSASIAPHYPAIAWDAPTAWCTTAGQHTQLSCLSRYARCQAPTGVSTTPIQREHYSNIKELHYTLSLS